MMSLSCWRALGSPDMTPSGALLKDFDGHTFKPHGIVPAFPVELGGKMVTVDVEVVDAPLDYNLLLGWSWSYAMTAIVSTVVRIICFPHQGRIVTIDQLDYLKHGSHSTGQNITMIENSVDLGRPVGVGMYPSLMGTFNLSAPINLVETRPVYTIGSVNESHEINFECFKTRYFNDR